MRVFVIGREFPTNIPDGFRAFKCAAAGCRKMASMKVRVASLSHLKNDTRCFCHSHGVAEAKVTMEKAGCHYYEAIIESASTGHYLMRRRADCHGDWKGWEYAVVLTADAVLERECPNPYALHDNDGNWVIREESWT